MKTLAASIALSLAIAALPRAAFAWPGDDGDIAFDVIAGNWQPWRIDPEGTMPARFSLPGSGSKAPLRWSPDGERVTYQEYMSGQGSRIWVGPVKGLKMPLDIPRRPDRNGYDTTPYSPSWHPDGRHIVYDQAGNIYLRNLDTGADTQLTFDGSVGSIPARPTIEGVAYDFAEVSPDGQKVVLMYTRWARLENGSFDAPQDVAVIPITGLAAGATPELITDDRLIEYVPRWSPNGSEILFAKRLQIEGEDRRELVVRAYGPGGNSRVVFSNTYDPGYGAWGMSAAWSPTGQRIVFNARNQGGSGVGGSLFVIDAQGGEPRVLHTQPSAPGNNWFPYRPDWQPLPPRLRIEREVDVDDATGTMRYTLTVHNESEVEISGGRLVESISPAYNVQRPVNVVPAAELEWADDTGRITWALDPIPPSKSIELRYELASNWVRVEQAGRLSGVSGWPRASWTTPPNEPSPSSGPAAPTIELDGDPVVVSNSPENIPIGLDDGVMYRQSGFTVQGRFRTFNYKVLYPPRASAPATTKNFYHVLYNPGSEAVDVRRLASGVSVLPRVQALESGKEALAQYMSARAAPPAPTAVTIPGGTARALLIAAVTTAAGTSVVYTGFDDFIAGGELEYAEVMIDSSDAATFEADPSGFSLRSSSKGYRETDPPPYDHYRRGTYRHGARTITVPSLDDMPAKRYSLRLRRRRDASAPERIRRSRRTTGQPGSWRPGRFLRGAPDRSHSGAERLRRPTAADFGEPESRWIYREDGDRWAARGHSAGHRYRHRGWDRAHRSGSALLRILLHAHRGRGLSERVHRGSGLRRYRGGAPLDRRRAGDQTNQSAPPPARFASSARRGRRRADAHQRRGQLQS